MSHSKPRFPARTDVSKPVLAALCADACYDHSVRLVKLIFQKSEEKNEVQGARGISSHHDGRVCFGSCFRTLAVILVSDI